MVSIDFVGLGRPAYFAIHLAGRVIQLIDWTGQAFVAWKDLARVVPDHIQYSTAWLLEIDATPHRQDRHHRLQPLLILGKHGFHIRSRRRLLTAFALVAQNTHELLVVHKLTPIRFQSPGSPRPRYCYDT